MHDHQGDYGIDGSFEKVSARAQGIGIGAQAAALAVFAGISMARGRRLAAALAAGSTAMISATAVWY
ncbi:MAG TPA: SAM-dependent methyltransferase, partial [Mycobacterium sp.]|nr:SAM-dependent methyltransferase [Mycobacterium sp.]